MRNLLSLPAELLASILSYLDAYDLLDCSALSKQLYRLISTSSKLQYTISLAKHKLVSIIPDTTPHPPYATRLRVLKEREKAWRELEWRGRRRLKLPQTGSVYEFVGGIYGNGREDENRVTGSISFLELPGFSGDGITNRQDGEGRAPKPSGTASNGKSDENEGTEKLRTWTHAMGDVAIIDFTMDPSQDLLVLVALAPPDSKYLYNLHLRTISTNEPHPKAPLPVLSCLEKHPTIPPPPEFFAAVRVLVSGDLVGLLIKEAPDPVGAHLEIWNWENDPEFPCSMSSKHAIDDFTFLSRSAFLIVLPVGRFEVYTFPDPLTSPRPPSASALPATGTLFSYPLPSSLPPHISLGPGPALSAKKGCTPTKKYSYDFPELSPGYMYWYISMSCNPAPGYVPSHGDATNPFPSSSSYYDSPSPFAEAERNTSEISGRSAGNGADASEGQGANQPLFYPLPDERIHACCIYIFNPNNHTTTATSNDINDNTPAASTSMHTPNTQPTTATASSSSASNTVPSSSMTGANLDATNNGNNDNIFIDDDLDEDNQQVHSFVFFLNLKTLLNPPGDWFHELGPTQNVSPVMGAGVKSSPFAALASGLGPLWRGSSSFSASFPAASNPSSPAISRHGSISGSSMGSSLTELSSAASLESSLNSLKRRQEEKELGDVKAALYTHASVNAKKKKRNGGSSSSLAVEVSLGDSDSSTSGTTKSMSSPSRSIISPPKASTSSSAGPTYPPFPTFSSPLMSSPSGSGRARAGPSGSNMGTTSTRTTSVISAASSGSSSSAFDSPVSSSWDGYTTMTSLHSPPASSKASDSGADRRTTVSSSSNSRYAHRHQSLNGNMTSSQSHASGVPMPAAFASSAAGMSMPIKSSASALNSASPSKARSASVPPSNSGVYSQYQISDRSSIPIPSPSLPQSPTMSTWTSPILSTPNTPSQSYKRPNHHQSTSPHYHAKNRSTNQPIPWEIWGPSSTRWFEECLSTDWQHAIYGLRTVESVSARERDQERKRQRLLARMRELRAESKRVREEQEGLEIEDESLEPEVASSAGSLSGRKKLEKAKNEEAKRRTPRTARQLQKEREVDLILQTAIDGGTRKNRKKKGKEKERAQGAEEGKEGAMGPEEDLGGGDDTNGEQSLAKGKRKVTTSANLDNFSDDRLLPESKAFLEPPNLWEAEFDMLEEDEREDILRTDSGISFPSNSSDTSIGGGSGSLAAQSIGINSGPPVPPTRQHPRRFLRVRDFNPYSLKLAEAEEAQAEIQTSAHINGIHTDSTTSLNINKGKGTQRVLPPPDPSEALHFYSYPYPIHLNIAANRPPNFCTNTIASTVMEGHEAVYKAWGKRRVVREPSITPVKGVFKEDIVSWLPYTEVVSEETFEVTDVMMDDCRLLLLKVRLSS